MMSARCPTAGSYSLSTTSWPLLATAWYVADRQLVLEVVDVEHVLVAQHDAELLRQLGEHLEPQLLHLPALLGRLEGRDREHRLLVAARRFLGDRLQVFLRVHPVFGRRE